MEERSLGALREGFEERSKMEATAVIIDGEREEGGRERCAEEGGGEGDGGSKGCVKIYFLWFRASTLLPPSPLTFALDFPFPLDCALEDTKRSQNQ